MNVRIRQLDAQKYKKLVTQQNKEYEELNHIKNWKLRSSSKGKLISHSKKISNEFSNQYESQYSRRSVPRLMLNDLPSTLSPKAQSDTRRIQWLQVEELKLSLAQKPQPSFKTCIPPLSSSKTEKVKGKLTQCLENRFKAFQPIQNKWIPKKRTTPFTNPPPSVTRKPIQRKPIQTDNSQNSYTLTLNDFFRSSHKVTQIEDEPDVLQKMNLDKISYQTITDRFPQNRILKNILIEETMHQKELEVKDFDNEKYSWDELQKKVIERAAIENKTHDEYRRKCYFEYQNDLSLSNELRKSTNFYKTNHQVHELPFNQINKQRIMKISIHFKAKRSRIIEHLKKLFAHLLRLNLSPYDLYHHKALPSKPFERDNSHLYFESIKNNDIEMVREILFNDKFMVYQFDNFNFTGLHLCARRMYLDMALLLLEHNADPDCKDFLGRTPLYFAFRENDNKMIRLFLKFRASPWQNGKNKYNQWLLSVDQQVRSAFKLAQKFHLEMSTVAIHKREQYWSEKLIFLN